MHSVVHSKTYFSSLLKSQFYFKFTLSNIQNPDETKEKGRIMRFHCWGGGEGHTHTCWCDSPALMCLHLGQQADSRREGEAEAKLRGFEI